MPGEPQGSLSLQARQSFGCRAAGAGEVRTKKRSERE